MSKQHAVTTDTAAPTASPVEPAAAAQQDAALAELDAVYRFSAVPRDYVKYEPVSMFTTRRSLMPLIEQGRVPLCNAIKDAITRAAKNHPRDCVVDDSRDVSLPLDLPINYRLPSDDYFFGARVAHAHASEYIKSAEVKDLLSQSSFSLVEAEMGRHGTSPSVRLLLKYTHGNGRKSHWIKALYFATRHIRNACRHGRQSTFITTNFCHHPMIWRYKLDERGMDWVSVSITANPGSVATPARSSSSREPRFTVRFFWLDTDDDGDDGDDSGGGSGGGGGGEDDKRDAVDAHKMAPVTWTWDIKSEICPPGPTEKRATESDIVYAMEQAAPLG